MRGTVLVLPLLLSLVGFVAEVSGQQPVQTAERQADLERVWQLTSHDNENIRSIAWDTLADLGCEGFQIGAEGGVSGDDFKKFLTSDLSRFVQCASIPEVAWDKLRTLLRQDKQLELKYQVDGVRLTRTKGEVYRRKMRFLQLVDAARPDWRPKREATSNDSRLSRGPVRSSGGLVSVWAAAAPVSAASSVQGLSIGTEPPEVNDRFAPFNDNRFIKVGDHALSTISTDVDTSSYAWARGYLTMGRLPEPDSIRLEEFVNYFPYRGMEFGKAPIALSAEVNESPWNSTRRLVRIQIGARGLERAGRGPTNLVYLLDTSGSMNQPDKIELLKSALLKLTDQLSASDTIGIVTYAGSERLALDSANGMEKEKIRAAINGLTASGSTDGEGGLRMAYALARKNFKPGGVNRVILGTDGDYNVGVTSTGELTKLVEAEAKNGIALTGLGFGRGNFRDELMQALAQHGNGNAYFIDSEKEAAKVFERELTATLNIAAKDTKVQVEFNPAQVSSYRLLGYETRRLENQDFKDDSKDAGDLGAGHVVTVFYEIVPGTASEADALRFQKPSETVRGDAARELMFVKVRYKDPDGSESKLLELPVRETNSKLADASTDFVFASAVATFAQALRRGDTDGATLALAKQLAERSLGNDPDGYRKEFLTLVDAAAQIRFLNNVTRSHVR